MTGPTPTSPSLLTAPHTEADEYRRVRMSAIDAAAGEKRGTMVLSGRGAVW